MKKTVRILTAEAMAILLLSLLALLICVLAQVPLASAIYGVDKQVLKENFSFPVGYFIGTGSYCLIAVLLFVTAMKESKGFWIELLSIILIMAVIPFVQNVITGMQMPLISMHGAEAATAFSAVNSLCGMSLSFVGLGTGTCLVTCGMRIVLNRLQRV